MTGLAAYPNPFDAVSGETCDLTCALTLGPCHDDQAPEREDVSEGKGGLPMRFALRVVDDKCKPVTDADVDIWHCDAAGVYSSETADNPAFCTGDNAAALKARFFRGHRKTDENGVAWFNTCFPGWYSSRAIHVHFTVRRTSRQGDEYLTSQVAFPTDLIKEVCTKHPEYSSRGEPDTANTSDTVFPSSDVAAYTLSAQKMADGALLAWKTVIIRSSLSDSLCGGSSSGGPGMGGPPPRG
jgi:protocatechuate 3,4-dioxygenase beta subunit